MLSQYHIDRACAAAYGIRPAALKAKTKREPIIFARMLAMLLCNELLRHNWNRLKKNYGKKSHTTTRHAVLTARNMLSNNIEFREKYQTAKTECLLMLPLIRQNQQRYNMHFKLRYSKISINRTHLKHNIMSKNTYLKVSQTEQPCNTCQGLGFFYSKEHHNQLKKRMCYMCSGAGKQSSTVVHVDATE